jgi:4-amino-4-deoxy-L-arabinose transferase-like glycosyltransferase
LKQRPDWRLVQVWTGLLIWVTPSGAWFIVRPDRPGGGK